MSAKPHATFGFGIVVLDEKHPEASKKLSQFLYDQDPHEDICYIYNDGSDHLLEYCSVGDYRVGEESGTFLFIEASGQTASPYLSEESGYTEPLSEKVISEQHNEAMKKLEDVLEDLDIDIEPGWNLVLHME